MRPVPVVFLLSALTLQLSTAKYSKKSANKDILLFSETIQNHLDWYSKLNHCSYCLQTNKKTIGSLSCFRKSATNPNFSPFLTCKSSQAIQFFFIGQTGLCLKQILENNLHEAPSGAQTPLFRLDIDISKPVFICLPAV